MSKRKLLDDDEVGGDGDIITVKCTLEKRCLDGALVRANTTRRAGYFQVIDRGIAVVRSFLSDERLRRWSRYAGRKSRFYEILLRSSGETTDVQEKTNEGQIGSAARSRRVSA